MPRRSTGRKLEAKLVIVGSQSVGKTCLMTQFVSGNFDVDAKQTIGASFFPKEVELDGVKLTLTIWDTAGTERFRAMAPLYYRDADAAMVVYDLTRRDSFDAVEGWIYELRSALDPSRLVLCIVGNKNDLESDRKVSTEEGVALAATMRTHFMETSALTAIGVNDMFTTVAKEIVRARADQQASEGDPSILLGFENNNNGTAAILRPVKGCFGGCAK
eukprot:m.274740 g.274740  ORF g.274740 m.274740 type:complete len:217 (+) comp26901_c3_seq7:4514-5164(+)